jgi:hypothetical protein
MGKLRPAGERQADLEVGMEISRHGAGFRDERFALALAPALDERPRRSRGARRA